MFCYQTLFPKNIGHMSVNRWTRLPQLVPRVFSVFNMAFSQVIPSICSLVCFLVI